MTLHFGILVFPNSHALDLVGPYEAFAPAPDAKVHLIWKDRCIVTSSTGLLLTPSMTFADCPRLSCAYLEAAASTRCSKIRRCTTSCAPRRCGHAR